MITKKYYKLIRVSHEDSAYMRLKNVSNEAGIFKMVKTGNPTSPNLEYSLDGVTWTTYDFTTLPEVTVAAGSNIYFRGTNANGFNSGTSSYFYFSFNKMCEGHGNMCSLLSADPIVFSAITSIPNFSFAFLFYQCTYLITAPDLSNVTSVGSNSLRETFNGCTALTTAPDLSNVTSVNGQAMDSTFNGCTALTTAPDLSNVTSVGAYGMRSTFNGCTALTTAPDLSNVTSVGAVGFSSTFNRCTSLVNGPDLSGVTSAEIGSLSGMLQNCSVLNTATAPNMQNLVGILDNWLASAGTSVPAGTTKVVNVPTGATITTGSNSGIPTGWTRVDY